jgi:methyltransferase (TIGR00027 family)
MRAQGDDWDISTSVGKTALIVAQARALESVSPDPLVVDPFAAEFVRAAGMSLDAPAGGTSGEVVAGDFITYLTYVVAVRTRFFDDQILKAAHQGMHQIVLAGSGLDARSFRLPWPAGVTVYEMDRSEITAFKEATISRLGKTALCDRVAIDVDLRGDWVPPLLAGGFDPSAPAVWVAEGLFPYLSAHAQQAFCARFNFLVTPSSSFVFDMISPNLVKMMVADGTNQAVEDNFNLDAQDLVYNDTFDYQQWLTRRHWTFQADTLTTIGNHYKPTELHEFSALANENTLITARRYPRTTSLGVRG